VSGTVADDDERAEAEPSTALHDLGDSIDIDDLFLELEPMGVDAVRNGYAH